MAKLNIAPTKSNLLAVKEQLEISTQGYDLLEQKREILVMEVMHIIEKVKLLERQIDKCVSSAYPALKNMLLTLGGDRVERIALPVNYKFEMQTSKTVIGGMTFDSVDVKLPKEQIFSSILGSSPDSDLVMKEFFKFLSLLTQLASVRTIAWRLALEVKKTQRRVNALDKLIVPQDKETVKYIESVLEERERENVFVLKSLKNRQKK